MQITINLTPDELIDVSSALRRQRADLERRAFEMMAAGDPHADRVLDRAAEMAAIAGRLRAAAEHARIAA